jgi:hypothetical protein
MPLQNPFNHSSINSMENIRAKRKRVILEVGKKLQIVDEF